MPEFDWLYRFVVTQDFPDPVEMGSGSRAGAGSSERTMHEAPSGMRRRDV